MATTNVDLIPLGYIKRDKHRIRHSYTYEVLGGILGMEGEVVEVYIDRARGIITFTAIPDHKNEENKIYEAQETPETVAKCKQTYDSMRCSREYGHRNDHIFWNEDQTGYYELSQ